MIMEKSGLLMDVIGVLFLLPFHNQILWASARVPAGSVPSTQSQKREVGTIALWLLLPLQLRLSSLSAVFDFNTSLNDFAPLSPILLAVVFMRMEEWIVDDRHLCVVSFVLPKSLSLVSVVFDFNTSLNDVVPLSPIMLTVGLKIMEKTGLLVDAIYVLFLWFSQPRLSFVSVVFDFNASLNNDAPVSSMSLSVYVTPQTDQ